MTMHRLPLLINMLAILKLINFINSADSTVQQTTGIVLTYTQLSKNITQTLLTTFNCNSPEDCSSNGICGVTGGNCICDDGFTTFIDFNEYNTTITNNGTQSYKVKMCNYAQRRQLTAFCLSLLVGFGSEHFYLGKSDLGISKLVFYMFCCIANIIFFVIYMFFPQKRTLIEFIGQYEAIYLTYGFVMMLLWNIYDLYNIGTNAFTDGNEIGLYGWK